MLSDNKKQLAVIVTLATSILIGSFIVVVAMMRADEMDEGQLAQIEDDAMKAIAAAEATADPNEAAKHYEKARRLLGTLWQATRRLEFLVLSGDTYAHDRNQYARALSTWQQAVTIDPNYAPAREKILDLHAAIARSGRPSPRLLDTIVIEASKLIEIDPTNIKGYLELAFAKRAQQKPDGALEALAAARENCKDAENNEKIIFEEAICFLMQDVAKGERGRAIKHIEDLVKAQPELPEARVQLARMVLTNTPESMTRSLEILTEAEKKFPKHEGVLGELARHYRRQAGMTRDAEKIADALDTSDAYYRKVVEAAPDKPEYYLKLAESLALRNSGRPESLTVFRDGLGTLKPLHTYDASKANLYRNVKFGLLIGLCDGLIREALQLRDPKDAGKRTSMLDETESRLNEAGIIAYNHPKLNLLRGKIAFGRGKVKLCIKELEEAEKLYVPLFAPQMDTAKSNPFRIRDLLDTRTWLSQAYLLDGRLGNAILQAEFVLSYTPTSRVAMTLLLDCHLRTFNHEEALKLANQLLKQTPENVRYLRTKATALRGLRRFTEAVKVLRGIPSEAGSAEDRQREREIARVLLMEGRYDDAEKILRDVLTADPKGAQGWYELYRLLTVAGKKADAQKALDEALKANPGDRRLKLIQRMAAAKTRPEREKLEEEFIKGGAEPKLRHLQLARFQRRRQKPDLEKAIEHYRQIETLEAGRRDAIEGIIDCAILLKQWSLAEEYVQKHRKGNFDRTEGLLQTGKIQLAKGDAEQAVRTLEAARDKQPRLSQVNSTLATALRAVNRINKAFEAVDEALAQNPNNAMAWRLKILLLKDQGKWKKALEAIADAGRRRRDPWLETQKLDVLSRTDRPAAIAILERLCKNDPTNAENLLRLAGLYAVDGKTTKAMARYKEAHAAHPEMLRVVVAYARHLLRNDRYGNGLVLFQEFIAEKRMPDRPWVPLIAMAQYQAVARQFADAQSNFLKAAEMAPKEQVAYRALADFYWQIGRYQLARGAYLKVKELSKGKDAEARKRLVQCYLNLNQNLDAETEIGEYVLLFPRDPAGHLLRALTILAKGRNEALLDSALEQIDRALQYNPRYVQALYHRGRLLWFRNFPQPALEALRQAKVLEPANMNVRLLKAKIHAAEGDTAEAVAELEDALRLVPDQHDAMVELCRLYATTKALPKLRDLAERGVRTFPQEAIWPGYMGQFYQATSNYASAVISFQQAVRLSKYNPLYVDLLLNVMGLAKRWQPLVDRAEKILRESAPLTMPDARRRRIQVIAILRSSNAYLFGLKDEAKGKELLQKAILVAVDDEEIRNWLYRLLLRSGRLPEAQELLAKAIEKNPQNHALRLSLAWLRYRSQEFDEARKLLVDIVAEVPEEKRAWQQLALVNYNLQNDAEAKKAFQKALDLDASDFSTLNNFAWFLADRLKEYDTALTLAYRAAALKSDNATVLDTVGWIEHLADKTEKAIETLRKSMQIEKIAANTYHLAAVHHARGTDDDAVSARRLARKAIQLDPKREKGEYGKLATALLESLGQ